jgi:hypothetical protein
MYVLGAVVLLKRNMENLEGKGRKLIFEVKRRNVVLHIFLNFSETFLIYNFANPPLPICQHDAMMICPDQVVRECFSLNDAPVGQIVPD